MRSTTSVTEMTWREIARTKQEQLWNDVPQEWKALASDDNNNASSEDVRELVRARTTLAEQQITESVPADLLESLARGDVSAQEALQAFAHRAWVAHQYVTCLAENNLSAARASARRLDAHWRLHRAPIGPLHGLPVSLMDRFHIAGLDSACAFASWVGRTRTAQDEGSLVRLLALLGAVVHCKTNVPMSIMLGETTNNILGTTVNPYNRTLSAGGACGGEGALVSLHGSPLGIGTDVAGSCRIPPAFCGLWAIKCSENRLPRDGLATVLPGLPIASGAIGLLSNDRPLLEVALKAILTSNVISSDPEFLNLPWRHDILESIRRRKGSPSSRNGRLVFGIMECDGHVHPHPPIQRAIDLVTTALRKSGHEVVKWTPPPHNPAVELLFKILGSTAAIKARMAMDESGEPPIPQIMDWYRDKSIGQNSSGEFWELCEQLRAFQSTYKAYWHSVGNTTQTGRVPDGVILPAAPTLAVRPSEFHYYGYSAIANVLDAPSGVFPVTVGDRTVDLTPAFLVQPLSETDAKVQATYRPEDAHGMPVSLQVMCRRLEEETVLGLMEAIEESLIAQPPGR